MKKIQQDVDMRFWWWTTSWMCCRTSSKDSRLKRCCTWQCRRFREIDQCETFKSLSN